MSLAAALAPNVGASSGVRRRDRGLLVAAAIAAIGAVAVDQAHPTSGDVSPWPHLVAAAFALLAGAAQVLAAWDRADREAARGRWFRLYAWSGIVLFGGMAAAYLISAREPGEFDLRVETIPLMLSLPFAGVALVAICWPSSMTRVEALTSALDALVAVSALGVVWVQVVVPLWVVPAEMETWEHLDQVVMFGATALGLVLLAVSRRIGTLPLPQLLLLAGSILVYEASDVLGQVVHGEDELLSVTRSILGYAGAAALMVAFLHRPPIEPETERARAARDWISTLVPVGMALVGGLLIVLEAATPVPVSPFVELLTATMGGLLLGSMAIARLGAAREARQARSGSLDRVLAERTRDGWFRALVGDSREYVFVLDSEGTIVYASPRVERDVALHDQPMRFDPEHGHSLSEVMPGVEREQLTLLLAQVALDPRRSGPIDFTLAGHVGDIEVEAVVRPVGDVEFEGFVLTARDVTATRRLQNQLDVSSRHDPLTHLSSREGFLVAVQARLDDPEPEGRTGVVVLDLERFGALNDALGHETGDSILRAVADSFARLPAEMVAAARLAGDAFALLVVAPDPQLAVSEILEQARDNLRGLLLPDGREVELEFRSGYVVAEEAGAPSAEWCLEAADLALARARVARQATRVEYHHDMRAETERRVDAERLIRRALAEDGIVTYYQPVVRLDDGSARGAEALVRLRTPEGRMLAPFDFVPLAEEIGLIGEIGLVVLRQACADTVAASEVVGRPLSVSVNLAADQLEPRLLDDVRAVLADTGLAPRQLSLEITETTLADQSTTTQGVLRDLRAMGISILLDDFGTGYSSLSYLATLPVDGLKIDRSFVSVLGSSPSGLTLARLVVQLAEPLGLLTVAEGVETLEQADLLRGMGCTFAQGYLYARPVPFDEYLDRITGPLAVRSLLDP